METHILLAYTECVPGTDEAFNAWYDAVHVHDVLKVPGFVSARRFEAVPDMRGELPINRYLAIYEFETDDSEVALKDLRTAMRTMHIDPSLDMARIQTAVYVARGPLLEAPA
jgi:hypothetical protein